MKRFYQALKWIAGVLVALALLSGGSGGNNTGSPGDEQDSILAEWNAYDDARHEAQYDRDHQQP